MAWSGSWTRWVVAAAVAAAAIVPATAGAVPSPSATEGGPMCFPVTPASHPRSAPLRLGVDPGAAGNLVPVGATTQPPVDARRELAALRALRPRHRPLVIRLNRLFWSGGEPLLRQFAADAERYGQEGFDVEVQVRYHPAPGDIGNVAGWSAWVRHVVDVLGRNPRLTALTVTNEVNFNVSPNTSDGFYPGAQDALIQGVEAAADQLARRGWARRVRVGFTFAYRFNPATDVALFAYLGQAGGPAFRRALGFVGLDDYPGAVYPPAMPPGATAGSELASAIATMRECYLPQAGIPASVPIWVTENGFTSANHTESKQAAALTEMVHATRAVAGTYHVTDYRWFNLRDNDSEGRGTFDQVGLLRDDYSRKPAFAAFQHELAG